MDINNPQHLSNAMKFVDATNITEIELPPPDGAKNSTGDTRRYADCWWDELVQWGKDHPDTWIGDAKGEVPNASELIGYHVTINNIPATLVIMSYSQGGFENCVLYPGHLQNMEDLVDAWFGDESIEDYKEGWENGNSHSILDYTGIPEEWEVENEA